LLHHRRIPRREHGRHVDLACKQLIGRLLGRERKQLANILIDLIALESARPRLSQRPIGSKGHVAFQASHRAARLIENRLRHLDGG
jgi:hypothetical protein